MSEIKERELVLSLAHRIWTQAATEEEVRQMEQILLDSEAAREVYRTALNMELSLSQQFKVHNQQQVHDFESFTDQPSRRRMQLGPWAMSLASAAAIVLLVVSIFQSPDLPDRNANTQLPVIAQVTHEANAVWSGGQSPVDGEITTGEWRLESGVVRLAFADASVTLTGPAHYEIVNRNETRLYEGRLSVTSKIRDDAGQVFKVLTPTAEMNTLNLKRQTGKEKNRDYVITNDSDKKRGMSYGLNVFQSGETEIHVFHGQVEVKTSRQRRQKIISEGEALLAQYGDVKQEKQKQKQKSELKENTQPQQLEEGLFITPWGGREKWLKRQKRLAELKKITFDSMPFTEAWHLEQGITQLGGDARMVAPGPPWDLTKHHDNQFIVVFPESKGVYLTEDLSVDTVRPGRVWFRDQKAGHQILAGARLDSFVLQYNAAKTPTNVSSDRRDQTAATRLSGQVTFEKDIVGVIWSSALLLTSDEIVGRQDSTYDYPFRGIKPPRKGLPIDEEHDRIVLSSDRKKLIFSLNCGENLDQIRVLVASDQ